MLRGVGVVGGVVVDVKVGIVWVGRLYSNYAVFEALDFSPLAATRVCVISGSKSN